MVPQSNKIHPKMVAPKNWGVCPLKKTATWGVAPATHLPVPSLMDTEIRPTMTSCDIKSLLEPTKCILSQTLSTLVFVWDWRNKGGPNSPLPMSSSISAEWVNGVGGSVGVVLNESGDVPPSLVGVIEPENGARFTSFRVRLSLDRCSLALHLPKASEDVWSHAYFGPNQQHLTLLTLPETGIVRSGALLQRGGREGGTRTRHNRRKSLEEIRPMTLLYRSPTFAVVDIADIDPPPVSLTILTNEDVSPSPPSDSLTSSPEFRPSTNFESHMRPRSHSMSAVPIKGILKQRLSRSVSEATEPEESCAWSFDGGSDADLSGDTFSIRKSVRFAERVLEHSFKTGASILGQKKKNARREKNRVRRNSEDSSQGSASESEDHSSSAGVPPTANPQASPCTTIHETVEEHMQKENVTLHTGKHRAQKGKRKNKKKNSEAKKREAQKIVNDKYAGHFLPSSAPIKCIKSTGDSTDSGLGVDLGLDQQNSSEDESNTPNMPVKEECGLSVCANGRGSKWSRCDSLEEE